ncbi:MAG TPA: non-canonical purine NTP pyrophosphatase [Pyrinomonadaceae bacterium]
MIRRFSEVLVATSNEGKVREITAALKGLSLKIHTLRDFPALLHVDETGENYEDNATAKALGYARQKGFPAIAEDSGLEVEALGGRLGFLSARYSGREISDATRNQRLLLDMAHVGISRRSARFVSIVVLAKSSSHKTQPRVLAITRGVCEGNIAKNARGAYGFGFDSIFIPTGYDQTFGELDDSIKNQISHRAQSMSQMRHFLADLIDQT